MATAPASFPSPVDDILINDGSSTKHVKAVFMGDTLLWANEEFANSYLPPTSLMPSGSTTWQACDTSGSHTFGSVSYSHADGKWFISINGSYRYYYHKGDFLFHKVFGNG